ncbi:MAG TPA: glycosyltransferase family 4 protein, partial [Pirellulaceae bacterium]|nr:glycosyltransferase family 4 protein [Pirellulaceae bacterium]
HSAFCILHSEFCISSMRIAHLITRMIVGGAQENTLYNCEDLIRLHGDEVLLVTGPAIGPEGDLLQQGRGGEGSVEVPKRIIRSLRRAIVPWQDTSSYFALKQVIREFQPDVVHTHSAKAGFLGRLAAWKLRVPAIVHTVHGAPFHAYQSAAARSLFRACERYAAKRCHALISVADAMTDLMAQANVAPREQFTTIYSGIDVEPFLRADERREQTRRELGFAPEHVVVGKIARLFHLKGHADVIRAAAEVIASQPNVRFLFIGDGILRERLQSQIDAAGLHEHFRFAGLVPPSDIPQHIGAMDLLVHASLREGLARALPQALIAGKPVVSYDVDGAREVAIADQTGFLVAPQWQNLVQPLIALAADADLRKRLGSEGRRRFTDQFRHEFMTQRIRELYERVLNQPR